MKTKTILSIAFMLSYTLISAQQNTVASGDSFSGTGGSASISIGQIDYISTGASTNISEGVQQVFTIKQNETSLATEQGITFKVFPNPTQDIVNIHISELKDDFTLAMFDVNGRKIIQNQNLLENHTISMEQMASGMYIIQIFQQGKSIHTIQIIKN